MATKKTKSTSKPASQKPASKVPAKSKSMAARGAVSKKGVPAKKSAAKAVKKAPAKKPAPAKAVKKPAPAKAAKKAAPAKAAKKPAPAKAVKKAAPTKAVKKPAPAKAAKKAAPAKAAKKAAPAKAAKKSTPAKAVQKAVPIKTPAKPIAAKPASAKPVSAKVAPVKPAPVAAPVKVAPVKAAPVAPAKPLKPFSAKKMGDFACGDYVVYPTHGVGQIDEIVEQEIAGFVLRLFVVRFEKEKMTLRVPINKAEEAGLRKLSTRQQIDVALATLKGRSRVSRAMWSRRAQEYEAKINSGDPVAIAEVVRDLHRNAGQPDQSYSERQIYERALERLACELAAVEKIDSEAATVKLEQFLVKAA